VLRGVVFHIHICTVRERGSYSERVAVQYGLDQSQATKIVFKSLVQILFELLNSWWFEHLSWVPTYFKGEPTGLTSTGGVAVLNSADNLCLPSDALRPRVTGARSSSSYPQAQSSGNCSLAPCDRGSSSKGLCDPRFRFGVSFLAVHTSLKTAPAV
jgi:hypothetical protein